MRSLTKKIGKMVLITTAAACVGLLGTEMLKQRAADVSLSLQRSVSITQPVEFTADFFFFST